MDFIVCKNIKNKGRTIYVSGNCNRNGKISVKIINITVAQISTFLNNFSFTVFGNEYV